MAIVPLSECRMPTLIASPLAAAGEAAVGEDSAAGDSVVVEVVVVLPQAFNKMLVPKVAEPYSKNFRRLNCLAIEPNAP
ncbi:MAG: hypothetical protein ACKO7W_14120 [Elainella sp.]